MEPSAIKAQMHTRNFDKFYIFTGPEWKVQRIYIEQISKLSGKELKYIDAFSDIYSKINNRSFLSKPYVYVLRDDRELMQNEELQSKLSKMLNDNILILLLTTLDKRTKFYKTYKDTICEFEALQQDVLRKYLQREVALSDKNCNKLMEVCEYDYGRCLLEIDKIKNYVSTDRPLFGTGKNSTEDDCCFEMLLKDGTIYQPPKDAIFDFVDAVLDRDICCFDLYEQCVAVGEAVMVMLTVLYTNAKAVLQVQNCTSSNISKSTGLVDWQIRNAKKHVKKYANSKLINIMKLCQECQQGIVTGTIDEEYVIEYILVSVL